MTIDQNQELTDQNEHKTDNFNYSQKFTLFLS